MAGKDPQTAESTTRVLFPVRCSEVLIHGSVKTGVIQMGARQTSKIYYSEPFPGNNHPYNFRLKLLYEGEWRLYITWIPDVLQKHNATLNYTLALTTTGGDFDHKNIEQHRCCNWIYLYGNIPSYPISITKIAVIHNVSEKTVELPNPLLSLLDDDDRTVELIGSDSAKVTVCQGVLVCRSEVFSRMFAGDWQENKEKCVNIKELNQEALQELKEYLYATKTPNKYATRLFALANVYQMEDLIACCAERMYKQLTPDNAMYIMSLAALYEYKPLARMVSFYCEENCW